jgi:hypothetical protein
MLLVFHPFLPSLSTLSCLTARALCHSQHATHPHALVDTTMCHVSRWYFVCVLFTGVLRRVLLVWSSPLMLSPVSFSFSLFFSPKHLNCANRCVFVHCQSGLTPPERSVEKGKHLILRGIGTKCANTGPISTQQLWLQRAQSNSSRVQARGLGCRRYRQQ